MHTIVRTIVALALVIIGVTTAAPADASSRSFGQRCVDQHRHPHSATAHRCERRNWVITRSYVIAPDGRLWTAESGWDVRHPVDFDQTLPPTSGAYWWNGGVPCKWNENPFTAEDDDLPLCPPVS